MLGHTPFDPSDWSISAAPRQMLEYLYPTRSEGTGPDMPRKLRLYLTALGREQWERMPFVARVFVAIGERMAEGWRPEPAEFDNLFRHAEAYAGAGEDRIDLAACERWASSVPHAAGMAHVDHKYSLDLARLAFVPLWRKWPVDNWVAAHLHRADLIRDIHPPPGQPAFDPRWRTDTATELSEEMYAAADFGRLPILADALQDAGCEDANVLAHCRDGQQPHVRGCWVVDQVLEKPA